CPPSLRDINALFVRCCGHCLIGGQFYGKRQYVTQPTGAPKIAIPRANPAQRGGAGCAEDVAHRRISERSSAEYHPSNRSPQRGNVVLDFPIRRRRVAPAIWCRPKPAAGVSSSDRWNV